MKRHILLNEIQNGVKTPEETRDRLTIANAVIGHYMGDSEDYVTNAIEKDPPDTYIAPFAKSLKIIQKKHAKGSQ